MLKTLPHENWDPNIQDDFLKVEYKSNDYNGVIWSLLRFLS